MKSATLTLGLLISLSVGSAPAAAKEPLRLEPSSRWHAAYQDDSCHLVREFGEGKDKVTLNFTRRGPGRWFRLTVASNNFRLMRDDDPYTVRFGKSGADQEIAFGMGTLGNMPALIPFGEMRIAPLSPAELEMAEAKWEDYELSRSDPVTPERYSPIPAERYTETREIHLKIRRKQIVLETGALDKPFAVFDACVDQLMANWGIDIERHKTLTTLPRPMNNPGKWMSSKNYPGKMLREGQPGLVQFRLNVDENGQPTDCHIQKTTRHAEFDSEVCGAIMENAKFLPALDAEGKPMPSYYLNSVRFNVTNSPFSLQHLNRSR